MAGIEALLALADLAGDRAAQTLVAPSRTSSTSRCWSRSRSTSARRARYELEPLARERGAAFVQRAVRAVRPQDHAVELDDGSALDYDYLVFCAGGRFVPAVEGATTFPIRAEPFGVDALLDRAESAHTAWSSSSRPGVTWSLPLYEIALMTQRRAVERGVDVKIAIVTPESARWRSSARPPARR